MLQMRGVSKSFEVGHARVQALRDIDLEVAQGVLTAVLGPSGSGKSTLLRVAAGFERPDTGTVTLTDPAGDVTLAGRGRFVRPERRGIGVVAQSGGLFPHLDVAGNIAFGLSGADQHDGGMPSARRGGLSLRRRARSRARVAELLDLVGLHGYERRRVDELSGGEQQRVALARALAPRPRIILLDEPFSALDAALRADLGVQVRDLLRELDVTAVLVTHDQIEALSLADRVVVMREGRIAQAGTPRQIYEQPADADTARFVGDAMILTGDVVATEGTAPCSAGGTAYDRALCVRCPLGLVPVESDCALEPGSSCQIVLRPESLLIGDPDGMGVPARVVGIEYYGHDAMLTVELGTTQEDVHHTVRVRTHDMDQTGLLGRSVSVRVTRPALVLA